MGANARSSCPARCANSLRFAERRFCSTCSGLSVPVDNPQDQTIDARHAVSSAPVATAAPGALLAVDEAAERCRNAREGSSPADMTSTHIRHGRCSASADTRAPFASSMPEGVAGCLSGSADGSTIALPEPPSFARNPIHPRSAGMSTPAGRGCGGAAPRRHLRAPFRTPTAAQIRPFRHSRRRRH